MLNEAIEIQHDSPEVYKLMEEIERLQDLTNKQHV